MVSGDLIMAIHILQGIIPIIPTSRSSAQDDKKFLWLSTILKPVDHYHMPEGSKGFHGKYDHKTGKNKPTTRSGSWRYVPITLGTKETGKSHGNVSYSGINSDNQIRDPVNGEIWHKITIRDHQVFLNDILIGTAPAGKTKAQKEKFCKAVIWSLMNDPECLKDKLSEIGIITAEPEKVIDHIQEYNNGIDIGRMYEDELTGYPSSEVTYDLTIDQELRSEIEISTIESDLDEADQDHENYEDDHYSDLLMVECLNEVFPKIQFEVISQKFLPHLNLTITEERCTA